FAEAGRGTPRLLAGEAAVRADTLATAIRIPEPVHRADAEAAVAESGGAVVSLADAEIVAAWLDLAREEGVFCEPSSAAGLAAVLKEPPRGERVVCVVTGHGLKDPEAVERHADAPVEVDPDADAISEAAA
ncbi:MAG: threonine synthase, partial [Gaiellaceae bacterium]